MMQSEQVQKTSRSGLRNLTRAFRLLTFSPQYKLMFFIVLIFLAGSTFFLSATSGSHTTGMYIALCGLFFLQVMMTLPMANIIGSSPLKRFIVLYATPLTFFLVYITSYTILLLVILLGSQLGMLPMATNLPLIVSAMGIFGLFAAIFEPLLYYVPRWAYFALFIFLSFWIVGSVNFAWFWTEGASQGLARMQIATPVWVLLGYFFTVAEPFVTHLMMKKLYRHQISDWIRRQNMRW